MGCAASTPEARVEGAQNERARNEVTFKTRDSDDEDKKEAGGGAFRRGGGSFNETSSMKVRRASQSEREEALGKSKFHTRAADMSTSVLSIMKAFQKFDVDRSGGLSVDELKEALEHLGISTTREFAAQVLHQYDQYPDQVIDIKEFSTCVREIKLMLAFDSNGDGVIDADELLPLLGELGVTVDKEQVQQIMNRFDVDRNGSIDLVELSSLVRTVQAFRRYDTDGSGTIEVEELRDALRKLNIRAGALEADVLFRRYDVDGNGSLELHEFAVLVCDLQLYASFDTDCDGSIDSEELMGAFAKLGMVHPASTDPDEARKALEAWDEDCDGRLNVSEFTRCVSDVSVFRDFDRDQDGSLSHTEFAAALFHLDVDTNTLDAFDRFGEDGAGEGGAKAVTLPGWGNATRALLTTTASFRHRCGPVTLGPEASSQPKRLQDDRI